MLSNDEQMSYQNDLLFLLVMKNPVLMIHSVFAYTGRFQLKKETVRLVNSV